MAHICDPLSIEAAKDLFDQRTTAWHKKSNRWLCLAIDNISSNEKLGYIGLKITDQQTKTAEIGFMLKNEARGRGYATEALCITKDYAFSSLHLNKLIATCSSNNHPSYKLLEKAGFVREAKLEQNSIINNKHIDDYLYGLLASN